MSQENNNQIQYVQTGGSAGIFIAGFLSYVLNGFWWSIFQCWFSWLYIIYAFIFNRHEIIPAITNFFN